MDSNQLKIIDKIFFSRRGLILGFQGFRSKILNYWIWTSAFEPLETLHQNSWIWIPGSNPLNQRYRISGPEVSGAGVPNVHIHRLKFRISDTGDLIPWFRLRCLDSGIQIERFRFSGSDPSLSKKPTKLYYSSFSTAYSLLRKISPYQ